MSFSYSVYIPRVFKGITQDQIRGTFHGKQIGKVGRIDLLKVYSEKGTWVYNKAFIHFDVWESNPSAMELKKEIERGNGTARILYETDRYWMLLPNASEKVPDEEQNNTCDSAVNPATPHMQQPHMQQPHMQRAEMQRATMHMMVPPPHPMYFANTYGIHPHIMMNPYAYMEPPPNCDRPTYFTNYTAANHAYFKQFPKLDKQTK